ncbi:Male discoverer [Thalictrum thalictroides]|uniref:Male discoverer n=1 Tax=Thalictrum thalictroides TaxID=46969 RepID=A0A7J6UYS2_THATH|nr:Male discoverer [Thalictrum thalictroides]
MGSPWNPFGFQLHKMFCFVVLISFFKLRECWCINLEGLALLDFRANVGTDPYSIFTNWNPNDCDPCKWSGVHCDDGKVHILDLSGLSLEGTLAPELGKLSHLKSLILYKNHFTGVIPKEFGDLISLEILDLSSNNLSGNIPAEIGQMLSLKRLILCNNKFHGSIPLEVGKLTMLSEIQFDRNLTFAADSGVHCLHRKFGHCIWQKGLKQLKEISFVTQIKRKFQRYVHASPWSFRKSSSNVCGGHYCENLAGSAETRPHLANIVRRQLLEEFSNLPAIPTTGIYPVDPDTPIPSIRSSGSFPAKINANATRLDPPASQSTSAQPPSKPTDSPKTSWITILVYVGSGLSGVFLLSVIAFILCTRRNKGATSIRPWKTGISGQLQKAFVTGVPKLNRSELESACEDFSNIITTLEHCTVYKGTLSSGVEIAVASTSIKAFKDWSSRSEMAYRKKIDSLSRVNHKNFVNLLGYCEEDEPLFSRMMVFEYAPSGSLFEHLHVQEVEHLDWNARTRVIMGVAYCLQYMHELNPPIAVPTLQSNSVMLTDDYAAKIADMYFWADVTAKSSKISGELVHSELPMNVDSETNVYSFGLLLLEIISGKLPSSEKHGSLLTWASEYWNDEKNIRYITDPTLKSFKNTELDILCDVIKQCIHEDPRQRPTMREIITTLREVIAISPEAATPRLSPLWWAELEILSVEAT